MLNSCSDIELFDEFRPDSKDGIVVDLQEGITRLVEQVERVEDQPSAVVPSHIVPADTN